MSSNRRKFIVAAGTGVAATLAGCLGGGGGGGGDGGDGSDGSGSGALSAPVMGPSDADVVVKSWEDFRCPHCQHFHLEILSKLESEYVEPGEIRVERHDFPIPIDELSWTTAGAARSVQDHQGDEAFWKFADRAYERQRNLSTSVFREIASNVGANPDQVAKDAENGTYRQLLQDDRQKGSQKGVSATPAIFVNGNSVENRYEAVKKAIENAK